VKPFFIASLSSVLRRDGRTPARTRRRERIALSIRLSVFP
jgi:hypothetical protein